MSCCRRCCGRRPSPLPDNPAGWPAEWRAAGAAGRSEQAGAAGATRGQPRLQPEAGVRGAGRSSQVYSHIILYIIFFYNQFLFCLREDSFSAPRLYTVQYTVYTGHHFGSDPAQHIANSDPDPIRLSSKRNKQKNFEFNPIRFRIHSTAFNRNTLKNYQDSLFVINSNDFIKLFDANSMNRIRIEIQIWL